MNRRDTLKALGLAAAGGALLLDGCGPQTQGGKKIAGAIDKLPGVQDWEHARYEKLMAETFFTEHERATIGVLADMIIPADDVSGSATDAGVPDFIEFIVKDIPAHQTPMRGGLKWLDVQCQRRYGGRSFIDCEKSQQQELVDEIAYPAKAKPGMGQGVAFFSLMRNLTASGFFTSEMGVKDIGYVGNKPGVWDGVPEDVLKEHGFEDVWG